jgi:hypothetical protein
MNREKFPERIPFRLTRMLIKAMEISGIEGSYRSTCERTMSVLRENRNSIVATLEAFLYDPLIGWRLVDLSRNAEDSETRSSVNKVSRSSFQPEFGFEQESGVGDSDSGGVPIDMYARGVALPISEGDEDNGDGDTIDLLLSDRRHEQSHSVAARTTRDTATIVSRARSLQMYANIQTLSANLGVDDRIASITGGDGDGPGNGAASRSIARSRLAERSMRQRQLLSLLESEQNRATEGSLNEKALKVIRRVQDKHRF